MAKFRKKPVVIEARKFEVWRGREDAESLAEWCGGRIPSVKAPPQRMGGLAGLFNRYSGPL